MIRKLLNGDIDRVADIWLKTNLKAHYFISNQYWKSNYELVKEMMSQYEVYVFEADKMIQGFVGLNTKMSPIRLTMDKRHFMSYLFYQVLEFNVIGILHKI